MADDPVQRAIGDFGRWHFPAVLSIFIYKLPLGWHVMAVIFLAPKINFTCVTPNVTDPCSKDCNERKFDDSVFENTITSEWDLVCDRKYLSSLNQAIVMSGVLVGSLVFGIVSDKVGRRIPLYVTVIATLLTGIITAFIPWFWLFNVVRFINAFAVGGGLVVSYVSMMEIIGKPLREPLGISYQIPFWCGHLTLPLFSYFLRDWRHYQLAYSLATAISLPVLCFVYESPRWLLATGRVDEAGELMQKAAKANKLPASTIKEDMQTLYSAKHGDTSVPAKKGSLMDLFRTPNLRCKTLCVCFFWFACSMGYYGIVQYAGYLGKNVFATVSLSATLEVPGTVICIFMTKYWGRKLTMIIANVMTGVAMLLITCLPENVHKEHSFIVIILVAVGIAGMSMAFANAYLYSGELFPTVVRNAGMGLASMVARIGSILSPFIANLDQMWMSSLIFGIIPIIAALFCLFLPETKGQSLPETLEDGENFGRKKK